MKKNIFLTIFTALLLCMPAIHAAASSGATAYERYENALTNANINGIVAAFLDLPQSDRWNCHHLTRLIEALIKEKRIDPMYIDALEATFSSYSPLIKWLRSPDAEPSQELLAYLNRRIDRLSAPTQANAPAPIISQKAEEQEYPSPIVSIDTELTQPRIPNLRDLALKVLAKDIAQKPIIRICTESMPELPAEELRNPAPLRQLIEKHTGRTGKQAQPPFTQLITPGMLQFIASRLAVPLVDAQEVDIWNAINNLPSVRGVKIANTDIAQDLFEKVATQIAHDAYLQLRKEGTHDYFLGLFKIGKRQLSPEEGYNQLSPFLKTHFKGVSVQDLIDNDLLPATKYETLRLNNHFINNLTGLENIPDINNLYSLYLSNNLITEITPGSFTRLIRLRGLYLNDNQVTTIAPGAFSGLTALEDLHLNYNQITTIAPGAFTGLTALKDLHLNDNQVTTIASGAFTGLMSLQRLYLTRNQVTTIAPEAFTGLIGLQWLYLNNNQITEIAPDAFTGLTSLKILRLDNNQIITIAPDAFTDLTSLKMLDLDHNQITGIAPGAFTNLMSLRSLNLNHNQITKIAPGTFTDLTRLQILYLNNNQITGIAPGTFTDLMNLQNLYLYNNQITGIAPGTFTDLMNLQNLYLYNNPITEPEQQQIRDEIHAFAPEAIIKFFI